MSAISVTGLIKRFDKKTVLDGIDLAIKEGEIVAVMGSSGGGKTTLLKCITGLISPTEGQIEVGGVDVSANTESARLQMGLVFQSAALFDYLSVRDNVLFGVRRHTNLSKSEQFALCEELLETVGLGGTEDLMPAELSGGMRKRAGIARALALRPKVMLYDEPTTGLDPITAYTIDSMIAEVNSKYHVTSLVVSHDVSSVFRIADRVAFLDGGKLTFLGTTAEFEASRNDAIHELITKSAARSFF
ncbi:MAG: ATP-binding cassette domain-containing protein [Fimbriimonadaceae bacterium]|nr:ATP-binding cassette domain-containing protein [Fimbriimonadaceae bacterium]